jgi:hypothetical protein
MMRVAAGAEDHQLLDVHRHLLARPEGSGRITRYSGNAETRTVQARLWRIPPVKRRSMKIADLGLIQDRRSEPRQTAITQLESDISYYR